MLKRKLLIELSCFLALSGKIVIRIFKSNLGNNFYRLDDFLNLFILLVLLFYFYLRKDSLFIYKTDSQSLPIYYFSLFFTSVFLIYRAIVNLPYSFIHSDHIISILHANRISYLNQNVYEATWNEHTTLFISIQKVFLGVLKSLFDNDLFNLYLTHLFFSCICFLVFRKLLSFFTHSNIISFTVALFYFLDLTVSSSRVVRFDTRSFGSLLLVCFLYFFFSYIKKDDYKFLVLTVVFGTLAIYNLESYALTIGFLFLAFVFLEKPEVKKYLVMISSFLATGSLIAISLILNGELIDMWNLNVLFHLQSSRGDNVNLIHALSGVEFFPGINIYTFLIFSWPLFLYFNNDYISNKYIRYLNVYVIAEVLHLLVTGPRWIAYGQIFRVPLYIILAIYLNQYIGLFNIENKDLKPALKFIFSALVPFLIVAFIGSNSIFESRITREASILPNQDVQSMLINEIEKNTKSKIYFAWTENKNWSWLYAESGYLPATRMWLWLKAYEEAKPYYEWDERWGRDKIVSYWNKDFVEEEINLMVIDQDYLSLPDFILPKIDNEFTRYKCIDTFCIYKKNY